VLNIRKATKLKTAAQTTACLGDKTLVETIVEMEFAASCIPLVKSNTRAIMMTKMMKNKLTSSSRAGRNGQRLRCYSIVGEKPVLTQGFRHT
jgi:hypothetical protein